MIHLSWSPLHRQAMTTMGQAKCQLVGICWDQWRHVETRMMAQPWATLKGLPARKPLEFGGSKRQFQARASILNHLKLDYRRLSALICLDDGFCTSKTSCCGCGIEKRRKWTLQDAKNERSIHQETYGSFFSWPAMTLIMKFRNLQLENTARFKHIGNARMHRATFLQSARTNSK